MNVHVEASAEQAQSDKARLRLANVAGMSALVLSAPLTLAWIGLIAWSLIDLVGWILG